jgi:16S rRNA processing protein RimM
VTSERLVSLGKLVNVHATRGELRMLPYNPDSDTLHAGSRIVLRRGDTQQLHQIIGLRRHRRFLLLTLEGCESMGAAEALVGCEVCVDESDLPPTGPDQIYHHQLIGMQVVTTGGMPVGVIESVLDTPSHSVCVVRSGDVEHLVPFVADVVKAVDREQRQLLIEPLPGMLEP